MTLDRAWMSKGKCLEVDPDAFFPSATDNQRKPKEICGGCEVAAKCLQYAIVNEFDDGIWGGLNGRERRKLANRPQAPVRDKFGAQVAAMHAEGKSDSEIGRVLNIPRTTVANIRRAVA